MSSNMGNPHENIFFVGKIIYKRVFLSSAIFDDWVIEIGKVRKDPADRLLLVVVVVVVCCCLLCLLCLLLLLLFFPVV